MRFPAGAMLFCGCLAVHMASPNAASFDSRWTVPTAVSLLRHGDANLDEYLPLIERDKFYAIECVTEAKTRRYPLNSRAQCADGHFYNFYPVAVAALAAPVVFAAGQGLRAARPLIAAVLPYLPEKLRRPMPRAFLEGDFVTGAALMEIVVASLITSLTVLFVYLAAREFLSTRPALALAAVLAFGTPAWSTASRGLWQHGPSMMLLALALLLLVKGEKQPSLIRWAGAPLALAFYVRPVNIVPLGLFSLYVLFRHRRQFPAYAALCVPVVACFTAANLSMYGHVLAPYSMVARVNTAGLSIHAEMGAALAGNLFSPGRGLFVYVPLFLLSIHGLLARSPWPVFEALRPWVAAALAGHYLLISSYEDWWGGHCYGPRYFTDVLPLLMFPLIAVLGRARHARGLAVAFAALAAAGVFIHAEGALLWASYEWNVVPSEIRDQPGRIWDWRDPQFLRGVRGYQNQP